MERVCTIVALGILLTAAACTPEGEGAAPSAPFTTVQTIPTPADAGSGEPNLTTGADGTVLLSWIEPAADSGHALRFAALQDSAWTPPRTIASGSDWFVNWADFPSLLALDDGALVAHWLQRTGSDTYAYAVRVARSDDGGQTWSVPLTPHRDTADAEHGFVSLYNAGSARAGAVWLDGRKYAAGNEEMTLRHALMTEDGTLTDEIELDARVCDCCQTAVAQSGDDVLVFYRDRSEGEIRDISVLRVSNGAAGPPQRVHADEWHIAACPVNGPAADADGAHVAVAWYTAPADSGRVLVAFSDDGGQTFSAPTRVDDGAPAGRVDLLLLDNGDALVTWLERVDGAAEVRARRVTARGVAGASATVTRTGEQRASGFPRVTRAGDRLVFAWTEPAGDGTQVRTATARLP